MTGFEDRLAELAGRVGSGELVGAVEYAQPYAVYVHEILQNRHPNGQAKFLETALHTGYRGYLQRVADAVLDGDVADAMAGSVDDLADESARLCPKDLTLLSRSDHPTVTSNGATVRDRPPEVPRMSEAEAARLHRTIRRS